MANRMPPRKRTSWMGILASSSSGITGGASRKTTPHRPRAPTQNVTASMSTRRTISAREKPHAE